ncbi:hypothetical protein HYS31_06505 [Candidatus Woesearchaeota archaeon]|nr:hypothetical protein [Candidatus Woesearchaeota archaeon]
MKSRNIKNLRIIRILLGAPGGSLTKYRIAKLAECSTSWVIEFLRKLEKRKLVKETKVLDFHRLVDYYIQVMPKMKHFEFFVQEPLRLLKKSKLDYALTTYGAENFTSRHLFPSRYDIYIKEQDIDKWKSLITKIGLLGKGNLRLILTIDYRALKEAKKIKGIRIVSMPQLLIDLKREGGVCIEAYNLLVRNNV